MKPKDNECEYKALECSCQGTCYLAKKSKKRIAPIIIMKLKGKDPGIYCQYVLEFNVRHNDDIISGCSHLDSKKVEHLLERYGKDESESKWKEKKID